MLKPRAQFTKKFLIFMRPEDYRRIEGIAEAHGCSLASVFREAITIYLRVAHPEQAENQSAHATKE